MIGVPNIVIIVDQHEEYTTLQECNTLGIPTICLTNTNCDPDLANISIPTNGVCLTPPKWASKLDRTLTNGMIIRYDDNVAVVIDQEGNPKGTIWSNT